MNDVKKDLRPGDGLLLVDVQIDFCPGGKLPIAGGNEVVEVLNVWAAAASEVGVPVYASRDWHPLRHPSFDTEGGPWPVHCVEESRGAAFHPDLRLPPQTVLVTKGTRFDQDQNSAFDQTGFEALLRREGVRRLWVGGLAEDVCVLATVLDGRRLGFEVRVLQGGTRPVTAEGGVLAREKMRGAGAVLIEG